MASSDSTSNSSTQPNEEQPTFKEQLDQAANDSRAKANEKPNPIVEKITEYVPAAAKILGSNSKDTDKEAEIPGPPHRPHHDDKIEEFVRDQHRNNGEDDILSAGDK